MKHLLLFSSLLLGFSAVAAADTPAFFLVAKCRVTSCNNVNPKLDLCTIGDTFNFYKYSGRNHSRIFEGQYSYYNDTKNDLDLVGWQANYNAEVLETPTKYKILFPKNEGWSDLEIIRGENKTATLTAVGSLIDNETKATFNLNCQSRL